MTWVFAVTTVICAAGWLWRLYTKVVLQYVELTEQHVNLLLRRNT